MDSPTPQAPEASPAGLVDTWGRHRSRAARLLRWAAVLAVLAASAAFHRVWRVTGGATVAASSLTRPAAAPKVAASADPLDPGTVTGSRSSGRQSDQASAP
jgi:hypothetical protein